MMRQILEFAQALTRHTDVRQLSDWLLTTLRDTWQPQGALLAVVEPDGRTLQCKGWAGSHAVDLALMVDDFSHPLAYVLHHGKSLCCDELYGGARVDHVPFRTMLAQMDAGCGMLCETVTDLHGKPQALLVMFDRAHRLSAWQQDGSPALLASVFSQQWTLIRELATIRHGEHSLRDSLHYLSDELSHRQARQLKEGLIGISAAVAQLRKQIGHAASHRLSVLIQGETGSGKEVVARLLHQFSSRDRKPFVAINCAAIPENLIESELFGYQKGAFSGAQGNKTGLIAQANGGTLFLDEVGDMPLAMQAKLLRVLETRSYRPLGGDKELGSDFRLVAATHQPLVQHIAEGRFRQDLYHRLCQCQLTTVPLRERPEDIPALCDYFVERFAARERRRSGAVGATLLDLLAGYPFPGNVRELRNMLEVACAHTPPGEEIGAAALPAEFRTRVRSAEGQAVDHFAHISDLRQAVQQYEASVISARLHHFRGNRLLVAESLNLPKRTLDHKCQKLETRSR